METTQRILDAVRPKIVELLDTVREYESDTFSASASELTDDEAFTITIELTNYALQRLIDTDTLDGVRLSEELDNIRPEEEDESRIV